MDKNFETYLAMLESAAPASKKADFHAARELYAKRARLESDSIGLSNAASWGKSDTATFGGSHLGVPGAKRDPEQVKADNARAEKLLGADRGFDSAADTVISVAQQDPGKVDAWVDYRLKPAIQRARETGNIATTPEEFTQASKETYNEWAEKYKTEDREKRETEERLRKETIAKADDIARQKANGERIAADVKAGKKLNKADQAIWDTQRAEEKKAGEEKNRLGGIADRLNFPGVEDGSPMSEKEFAGVQAEKARLGGIADNTKDEGYEAGNPISEDEFAANKAAEKAEQDKYANLADTFDFDMFESVATHKLRAAFESVYGSSRGMSDAEIRTICESCYRRSKQR